MSFKISSFIHRLKTINLRKRLQGLLPLILLFFFSIDTYSQTSFSIIIPNIRNNSIDGRSFTDNTITKEKIKNNSVSKDTLSGVQINDGNLLKFYNKKWISSPLSGLKLRGNWNIENSKLPGGLEDAPPRGHYFIVTKSGNASVLDRDKIESWYEGDWAISDGKKWQKIENTGKVSNFMGREGSILPQKGDYSFEHIEKESSKLLDFSDTLPLKEEERDQAECNDDCLSIDCYCGTICR